MPRAGEASGRPGFWRDESAQTTVEYLLLLSAVVSFFLIISKTLLQPVLQRMQQIVSSQITKMLSSANLHSFKIGR